MTIIMRSALVARRLALRPALAARFSEAATGEGAPPKYENVRKLLVGLGNPRDKFARTRCGLLGCCAGCCWG